MTRLQLKLAVRHPPPSIVKQRIVATLADVASLENTIADSAAATLTAIYARHSTHHGLLALALLKFDTSGCDPLNSDRPLNFIEQLNQSFTYLATIEGVRWLLQHHPEHAPYQLNLGTAPGSDIVSEDGAVVAETFAATHPGSNRKLQKDIAKVAAVAAQHRYVFYLSRAQGAAPHGEQVTVVRLDHACLQASRTGMTNESR